MSSELIGILSVTVGGLVLSSLRAMRGELRGEIHQLAARIGALDSRMGALEQRVARLGGVLEDAGLLGPSLATGETVPSAGD